jgi:hypothetical protein
MTSRRDIRAMAISGALEKCSASVEQVRHERWAFALSNGADLRATARLDDDWLLLETSMVSGSCSLVAESPGGSAAAWFWKLLGWNATLAGGVKFALPPGQSAIHLRAELPLDEEVNLTRRIVQACAGLKMASARFHRGDGAGADGDGCAATVVAENPPSDLAAVCRESGWAFIERESGNLAVDLDVPGTFQQALVESNTQRGVAVSVALTAGGEPPLPLCQEALGLLLLRSSAVVRMARAAVEAGESGAGARFEAVFADAPSPQELAHALAALSVAWRLAGREAGVLANDEAIARQYLNSSPWSVVPGP